MGSDRWSEHIVHDDEVFHRFTLNSLTVRAKTGWYAAAAATCGDLRTSPAIARHDINNHRAHIVALGRLGSGRVFPCVQGLRKSMRMSSAFQVSVAVGWADSMVIDSFVSLVPS